MRESINTIKAENMELRERVTMLESQITTAENEMENMKQYVRRDLLEIRGVPVSRDENTNSIVKMLSAYLIPLLNFKRKRFLPAPEDKIPPIFVNFTHRHTRDYIFSRKRQSQSKTAAHLGSPARIASSWTKSFPEEQRAFKKDFHFKFVWTKQGRVFLSKDESSSTAVHSFATFEEFVAFKVNLRQASAEWMLSYFQLSAWCMTLSKLMVSGVLPFCHIEDHEVNIVIYELANGPGKFNEARLSILEFNPLKVIP